MATKQEDVEQYILRSTLQREVDAPAPGVGTLPDLFQWQARRRGAAPFLTFQAEAERALTTLTYQQTYDTTVRLAKALRARLDFPAAGSFVAGIWLEKSIELHLATFAATCAGATWLPFDADAPSARVAACLQDSEAKVLLCDDEHFEKAVEATRGLTGTKVLSFKSLSALAEKITEEDLAESLPRPQPHDAAYLIYTSGSTGTPKGIEIPHGAALTFSLSEQSVLQTGTEDVVWQGFSAAFDMFIEEVWVSIAGGAQLAIGSRSECRDVPQLGGANGIWAKRGVTLVNAVPTLINIMTSLDDEAGLPKSIRLLNLGGEACPPALVKRLWHPNLRIINTYGPSETTVTATYQELFPDQTVTIGKPLPSYHALLLPIEDDYEGRVRPTGPLYLQSGVEGELAIGGPCLGNGYVKRPELTSEKFINHPFYEPQRIYRTGDRVRLDADLNLLFCGRIDTQVKHRGFRIELGEIENAIATHDSVQTAAVILSSATKKLEAYVVVRENTIVNKADLKRNLSALPAYMLPEAFFFLAAQDMPRLPSGKINAKVLQDVSQRQAQEEEAKAAEKSTEDREDVLADYDGTDMGTLLRALAFIFPQAGSITPDSDFFDDLGGHSLVAAMLVSKLRKEAGKTSLFSAMGLQDVYIGRTPREMVDLMTSRQDAEDAESDDDDQDEKQSTPKEAAEEGGVSDHLPITNTRFILCGLAQIPALLFLWFLQSLQIIVPYFVFYGVYSARGLGDAIATTYCFFVVVGPVLTIIAIIGKWLILGKAKAGEYPLYGVYYFRWWFAGRLLSLIDFAAVADTPLNSALMRALGARVGYHCHLGDVDVAVAYDLVDIGEHTVIGKDVHFVTSFMERGRLVLKPVSVGSHAFVGSNSVLEGGAVIEEGGEVKAMTMVPDGRVIPAGQRWHGSPARFLEDVDDVGNMSRTRPSEVRLALLFLATTFSVVFLFPIISFAAQIPSIILFEVANFPGMGFWAQTAIVAIPAAIIYMVLLFVELVALRWLILGRLQEGSHSIASVFYFRKWFVDRLMAMSLLILHPVYATLYVVPFLRLIGVKIGKMAEISTARGINFNLTEIGDESFIADAVLMGDAEIRNSTMTLEKTVLENRAFAGNASLLPQGTRLASNTLVGVLSVAPDRGSPLKPGQSCFGTPPVLMPARQMATTCHASHLLYAPKTSQVALRLFIEGMRIVLPRILIVYGLGMGVQIFELAYEHIGVVQTLLMLPFFYFFLFALPSVLFVVLIKWLCVGKYVPDEWPLWSVEVWLSEFVTSTYETLLGPLLTNMLVGTPYLAWVFRMLGVQIGARAALMSNDITEYDLVSLGDESMMNMHAGPQTHLFEDRVMKLGRVDLERRACMKPYSICLPNSSIGEGAQLGSLSLVMKSEAVPAGQQWEGAPIAPRRRPRAQKIRSSARVTEKGQGSKRVVESSPGSVSSEFPRIGRPEMSRLSSCSRLSSPEDGNIQ